MRRISLDGTGGSKVRELYGGGTLAISPDRKRAVVSQMVSHREFYWFEYEQINDLLAPANEMPEVSIIQMDEFQQFLNAGNSSQ